MSAREGPGPPGPGRPVPVFSAPPFDMLEDLCGDPSADLVVFMAGNQFMVLPDLVAGFLDTHPSTRSVFYETLPPGIVARQVRAGALQLGTLHLSVPPDVIALSPDALHELRGDGLVEEAVTHASNDLAVMVGPDNPAGVSGLADLGRPELRVAMPDPETEGIGRLALVALEQAGGRALRRTVEVNKRAAGSAVFTTIHHRQSPAWVAESTIDAAVVWRTEATYHHARAARLDIVEIDPDANQTGYYAAAVATGAPHRRAAQAFLDYLTSDAGHAIYQRHGFGPPGGSGSAVHR